MAYDEQLSTRVRRQLADQPVVEEKPMMGGLAFMVNGKMCVSVQKERMMARVGPEVYAEVLERHGCEAMVHAGRPMKGFVFISKDMLKQEPELNYWVGLALDFNKIAKASR